MEQIIFALILSMMLRCYPTSSVLYRSSDVDKLCHKFVSVHHLNLSKNNRKANQNRTNRSRSMQWLFLCERLLTLLRSTSATDQVSLINPETEGRADADGFIIESQIDLASSFVAIYLTCRSASIHLERSIHVSR